MGNPILILFIAIDKDRFTLPITDWMKDTKQVFDEAAKNQFQSGLYSFIGRGYQLYDILDICDRYKIANLGFLDSECTAFQGIELIPIIRSLTIFLDKLLSGIPKLKYLNSTKLSDLEFMKMAFECASVCHEIKDWDGEEEFGLFLLIKTLILVTSDALANDKVFLYINYSSD